MKAVVDTMRKFGSGSDESESSRIYKAVNSNKVEGSLGQILDIAFKEGHDLSLFVPASFSTMSSVERYVRFTVNMYGIYSAMEEEFDRCDKGSPNRAFWDKHREILRRTPALVADLKDVGVDVSQGSSSSSLTFSPGTQRYIQAIREAGESDRTTGGVRLVAHAHCRYLADLMGGQRLGAPTRIALALPTAPRHYSFAYQDGGHANRGEYIEFIYYYINIAGDRVTETQKQESLQEGRLVFACNVDVYSEEPYWWSAAVGLANISVGYIRGN